MARINLLPWREELRKQRKQEFATVVVIAAAVMGVVVFAVHLFMAGQIDAQEARNSYLRTEIKAVEAKIKEIEDLEKEKASLLSRIKVIESLQSNRPAVVHLLEELVKAVPDGLYITRMKQAGNVVAIEGRAESNARVSAFMRNLDASPWFTNPSLGVIKTEKDDGRSFSLTVNQSSAQEGSS